MNFRSRQLTGFVVAARLSSFSGAARELSITQPAFSQLIKDLEESIGVRLFQRTTRRVELTEAGQNFLARVERPLDDLQDAFSYLREHAAGRRGRVVLAVLPSIAVAYAIQTLAAFKKVFPGITVKLIEDHNRNLIQRVLQKEVDFAIGTLVQEHHELSFRKLLTDELLAVFPKNHRFGAIRHLTWRDIVSEPLILTPHASGVRELVAMAFAHVHRRLDPAYEVANTATAVAMVRAGIATTFVPRVAVDELNMSGLQIARIYGPLQRRDIGIIVRADRPLSSAAIAYVEMLFKTETAKLRLKSVPEVAG
jgi:DNA-binding transcriptional LysR family regulator